MIKLRPLLKKIILGAFISSAFSFGAAAQQWDTLGSGVSTGISIGTAGYQNIEVHNNTLYAAYSDGAVSLKATVKRYNAATNAWVQIGSAGFSTGAATGLDFKINNVGELYVAYGDDANSNGITVMKYNGSSWVVVGTANLSNGQSLNPSLAFDANDVPYIAYLSGEHMPSMRIVVKKFDGTNWVAVGNYLTATNATALSSAPNYADIVFDPTSNTDPYVAYNAQGNAEGTVVKQYSSGGAWVNVGPNTSGSDNILSAGNAGYQSMTFNANGDVYVAYRDEPNAGKTTVLKYAGGSWSTVGAAGFSAGVSTYQKIGISSNGTPYVAQIEQNASADVSVYVYNGNTWMLLGSAPVASGSKDYTDMVINNDVIYVTFQDSLTTENTIVLKYDIGLAIQKMQTLNNIVDIFPNPAKEQLTIEGIDEIEAVRILSVDGKEVQSIQSNQKTVAIGAIPQGVYLLEIRTAQGIAHKRFVKQ